MQASSAEIQQPNTKFIHALALAPNGDKAAVGNLDGIVHLLDMKANSVSASMKNHGMAVRALSFSSSSQNLVSAGEDLHIFVTDCETKQRKHTMVGHTKQITSIACHP